MKMMVIGLGKQQGANLYHRAFFQYGFEQVITAVGGLILDTGKIAFGIGLIENAHEDTAKTVAMPAAQLLQTERELLVEAKSLMGRLPFNELDLLIIDWTGKNISGTGMDTNVIGRMMQNFEPEPAKPAILRIFVRDITEESDGNATGIGLADFTTTRLVDKIDRHATYMNGITALGPQKSKIPFYYDTDSEAIEVALDTIGLTEPEDARVIRIESTLRLTELDISEVLLEDVKLHSRLAVIGETHSRSHLMLRVICCRFKDTFLYTCRPSGAIFLKTRIYTPVVPPGLKNVIGSRAQLAPTEEASDREHSSLLQKRHRIASTARSYRRCMGSRAQLAPTMYEGFARIKDAET